MTKILALDGDGNPVALTISALADLLGTTAQAPDPVVPEVLPWERLTTPSLIVEHVQIPPGQRYAHVKVTASHPPEATCVIDPSVRNVSGGGINVGTSQASYCPPHMTVWRPGDDAEHWITFDLRGGRSVGNAIDVILKPRGLPV